MFIFTFSADSTEVGIWWPIAGNFSIIWAFVNLFEIYLGEKKYLGEMRTIGKIWSIDNNLSARRRRRRRRGREEKGENSGQLIGDDGDDGDDGDAGGGDDGDDGDDDRGIAGDD